MNAIQKELVPGVELIAVPTEKFKTGLFSLTFNQPMKRETLTGNALVGSVLCRGSEKYPDMEAISAAQDELYGMSLSPAVRQRGESQCPGLACAFLDDRYTLDGEPVLEPALRLLGELLFRPAVQHGMFREDYVTSEGHNHADDIRALINDKRTWAMHRAIETMCAGEPYSLYKLGSAQEAEQMTPAALWERYQALLREAGVLFYYSGCAPLERVETAVRSVFAPLLTPRGAARSVCQVVVSPKGPVREKTERMEVAQGQLCLGFRTGGIDLHSPEFPALQVANAIYGGSANSRLFLNVREKLSLCYYASSALDSLKGLMMVVSGVAFENFERAREEMLTQLKQVQRGGFTDEELCAAKRYLTSSMRTSQDSPGRMEHYWLTQALAGLSTTLEEERARIESVTKEQVTAAAQKLQLDTVYRLTGEEE